MPRLDDKGDNIAKRAGRALEFASDQGADDRDILAAALRHCPELKAARRDSKSDTHDSSVLDWGSSSGASKDRVVAVKKKNSRDTASTLTTAHGRTTDGEFAVVLFWGWGAFLFISS